MDMTFFATTAKGIEAVLAREIESLGLAVASEQQCTGRSLQITHTPYLSTKAHKVDSNPG
jgi:23S rRNA G2445 N2-methylase RlmL